MAECKELTAPQRLMRSAILLICLSALLLTCFRAIGQGYFPRDDALRHVAKVVSGKDWSQILVVRPEITMDSHPGWHFILNQVGKMVGYDSTLLIDFSVVSLFLLFTCPLLFMLRRSEAWSVSLLIAGLFSGTCFFRLFFGRPFIFSMFLILMFCFLWSRIKDKKYPILETTAYILLTALSTWIHGTWYLLALPLAALFFCGQWRVLLIMSCATVTGVLLGAVFTGSPLSFLYQMIYHAITALGAHDFQRQLVTEFRPFNGDILSLTIVGFLLVWRVARNEWSSNVVINPVFVLASICWIMGFVVGRFWFDWGWPALAFWVATEIEIVMKSRFKPFERRRMMVAGVACLALFLSVSSDFRNRWSKSQTLWPDMNNAEHRPWLPDDGGIIYNDSMGLFYEVFYQNPHGPWRYMLGFEPIWMPEKDLETYRQIQLTRGKAESYQPWIKSMTEKDRMIVIRPKKPEMSGLEWHEITPTIWSGRLKIEKDDS